MDEITELEDQTNGQDPRISLAQWANESDEWVRRIVRLILDSNAEIAADERVVIYQLFLEENGLKERILPSEPPTVLSGQALGQPEPLYLTRISDVRRVNALVENAQIDFSPELTLLFGENGTERPDMLVSSSLWQVVEAPMTFFLTLTKRMTHIRLMQESVIALVKPSHPTSGLVSKLNSPLPDVSFDTPSVHFHTDADIGYTYRPASLALFDSVTREVHHIVSAIQDELSTLKMDNSGILSRFDNRSSIYPHIESLGAATNLSELQPLSALPDNATDRKAELEISIAGLIAGLIGQQIAHQDGFRKVLTDAFSYTSTLGNLKVPEYNLALAKLSDLRRDQVTLRASLFAADLPAPPDQTWEKFIRSGLEYRRHLESLGTPDDTRCLYCRQLLSNDAIQLIYRYGVFLEGQIAADMQEQERAVKELVKPIWEFSLAAVEAYIENMNGDIDKACKAPRDRLEAFRSIVNHNAGLQQKLADGLPIDENVAAGISGIRTTMESWLTDLNETLKEIAQPGL